MSELTALTLELATLRKRELQTSTQLETLIAAEKNLQSELTTAKLKASGSCLRGIYVESLTICLYGFAESEKQMEQVSTQLRDERSVRRDVEARLTSTQDELSDVREARDETQRKATQLRQKMTEESQKREKEAEDARRNLEVTKQTKFPGSTALLR